MYANTASSGWTPANVDSIASMTLSEVASPSVNRRTFWAVNYPLSDPSKTAISRTSLATAGSFGMGDG